MGSLSWSVLSLSLSLYIWPFCDKCRNTAKSSLCANIAKKSEISFAIRWKTNISGAFKKCVGRVSESYFKKMQPLQNVHDLLSVSFFCPFFYFDRNIIHKNRFEKNFFACTKCYSAIGVVSLFMLYFMSQSISSQA